MLVQVYRFTGHVTRSIRAASLVAEIEVDEEPVDLELFAKREGGHFVILQEEAVV